MTAILWHYLKPGYKIVLLRDRRGLWAVIAQLRGCKAVIHSDYLLSWNDAIVEYQRIVRAESYVNGTKVL